MSRGCGELDLAAGVPGYGLAEPPPEHSALSKTRKRMSLEAHGAVLGWVLKRLRESGLLRGGTVRCEAWLEQLERASAIETPPRADLAKLDRKQPGKGSNKDPHDSEARITRMKDDRTRLVHKLEVLSATSLQLTSKPAHERSG